MNAVVRFVRLPWQRRILLLRAASRLVAFRVALPLLPFPKVRHLAERPVGRTRGRAPATDDLAWAVAAAARRLPGATCLAQSLALQSLLGSHGYDSSLRIGVAKAADGALRAHAWLDHDGRTLIGGVESSSFVPLPIAGQLAEEPGERAP